MKTNLLEQVKDVSFIVFYGSQLGQAESIAENIVEKAPEYDFIAQAFPLNDIANVNDLTQLNLPIVIIASTTGDGEPPENADKFWRKIRKKALKIDALSGLKYTVLGLGDTNYNSFCNCGKEIYKRIQELGGSCFYSPGWADDAIGLDIVVDDWLEELWASLENLIRPGSTKIMDKNSQDGNLILPNCPPESLIIEYHEREAPQINLEDPLQPYPLVETFPVKAIIAKANQLTKPGSVKTTLEITLQFESKKLELEPGDAIGIICHNAVEEVQALFNRLNILDKTEQSMSIVKKENSKGKIPVHLPPGCTLRQVFLYYCDIRTPPKKTFLRLLAEHTKDDAEKLKLLELSSKQGATVFESTIRFPGLSLLDILYTYPSCQPPPEVLIEHLPRLIPRVYSISSSPFESKDSFTVAFNVISFNKEEGRKYNRFGVCTGWLMNKCKDLLEGVPLSLEENLISQLESLTLDGTHTLNNKEVMIYKRKNHSFRLPQDLSASVIMVGPGTGVAPFIGFLNHRFHQKKKDNSIGKMYLYFGCRNKDLDYLYEEQLTKLNSDGVLTNLYTSFSRDDTNVKLKYVQHNMEQNKEEIVATICDQEGYIYVCGDAKNMAKNVRETLIQCVQSVKGITEDEAKSLVAGLVTSKRYLQDVWN